MGNSGSGKSTLAAKLASESGAAVLDLDTIVWEPNEIAVARPVKRALADLRAFCTAHEQWIVEGCYAGLIEATLVYAPELLFLDPGLEACIASCKARPWEPHKYASKAEQDSRLAFLLTWVAEYYTRDGDMSHAAHLALFHSYAGRKRRFAELPEREPPPR